MRDKKFRLFLILLYIGTIVAYVYFVQRGLDYYLTPLQERPRHMDYAILKPGGDIGHGLGIIGSCMMMIMLLYSVRKRKRIFNKLGPISHWLDVHIYFGIFGPLFIILHSSFKVGGLVAISFYSMLAVALSGILGRYLYMQIPRNIRGHELSLKESELLNNQLTEQLKTKYDFTDEMINSIEKHTAVERLKSKSVTLFFLTLFWQDLQRFFQFRRMKSLHKRIKNADVNHPTKDDLGTTFIYSRQSAPSFSLLACDSQTVRHHHDRHYVCAHWRGCGFWIYLDILI